MFLTYSLAALMIFSLGLSARIAVASERRRTEARKVAIRLEKTPQ